MTEEVSRGVFPWEIQYSLLSRMSLNHNQVGDTKEHILAVHFYSQETILPLHSDAQ